MSTLKKRIEARKQEALNRYIKEKAQAIVSALGEKTGDGSRYKAVLVEKEFRIEYNYVYDESRKTTTSITLSGQEVFRCDGFEILGFVPGAWEKKIESLHKDAVRTVRRRERRNERIHEARRWGL